MLKDFKTFVTRGNVVDLAVGIVIGVAFGAIVNSFVKDIIMPPIGLALGDVDFSNLFVVLKEGTVAGPYASLAAAQEAVRLAPYLVNAQMTLMNVLQKLGRTQEAQKALEEAIILAKTVEPEFQKQIAANLEQYLERLRQTQKEQAP